MAVETRGFLFGMQIHVTNAFLPAGAQEMLHQNTADALAAVAGMHIEVVHVRCHFTVTFSEQETHGFLLFPTALSRTALSISITPFSTFILRDKSKPFPDDPVQIRFRREFANSFCSGNRCGEAADIGSLRFPDGKVLFGYAVHALTPRY